MKLLKSSLDRTNLACPSEWSARCEDGSEAVLSFRRGVLRVVHADLEILKTSLDQWDVSGYLSDEDLLFLLEKNSLLG